MPVAAGQPRRGWILLAAAGVVPLAWVWLQAPVLAWLWTSLPTSEYSSSLALLLLAGAFLATRALRSWRAGRLQASAWPVLRPAPLSLLLGCAAGSVALRACWDVNVPAAALLGLGTYGLWGLHVPPAAWRRAAPGALLLCAALPFGPHLDAYLGFPARLATAKLVHALFSAVGLRSIDAQTVLLLENGAMNVDLPCSGIRSAWTGLLFFLGATCLERPRLDWRWAASGSGYLGLLFTANATRVAVISLVAGVAGQVAIARVIHEPLGVAGFTIASLAAYALLRALRREGPAGEERIAGAPAGEARSTEARSVDARSTEARSIDTRPAEAPVRAPRWLPVALAAALALLALWRRPFTPGPAMPWHAPALPAALAAVSEPLSGAEAGLYGRHGAAAGKWRLSWQGHDVSLLVVHASSWRAHHPPEQCLRAAGVTVDADIPLQLRPDFAVRWLQVEGGRAAEAYWFQSPGGQVNDLLSRVAADWSGRERRWALITVMVDRPPADPDQLLPLFEELRAAVAASFPKDGAP
jgi:exosortase O